MNSFVYVNHTSINFFFKEKSNVLRPSRGQASFCSSVFIQKKSELGAQARSALVVLATSEPTQSSPGDQDRSLLQPLGCHTLPMGTCLPAVLFQFVSGCQLFEDMCPKLRVQLFPICLQEPCLPVILVPMSNPGPQFARHLVRGNIVPIDREPIP